MDIKQLEYFLTLVNQENISSSADLLNISQPALSKSISRLEQEVGVKLFDRHGNHIKLNEYGRNFALYAARSLKILENGLFSTRQSRYETNGNLHITCYAFPDILTSVISDYSFLNPNVQIRIHRPKGKDSQDIDKDDFLLCSGQESVTFLENSSNWVAQELFRESSVIIISEKYRSFPPEQTSIPLSDLKDEKFICSSERGPLYADSTFKLCSNAGFIPTVAFDTNDFIAKMRLVGDARAIALVPECCTKIVQDVYPDVRAYQIEGSNTSRLIYLLRRKKLLMSEAALDFWDFVLDHYQLGPDLRE